MLNIIGRIDKFFYPNITVGWDDAIFRSAIIKNLSPRSRILDYGAGRGYVSEMNFKEVCASVSGVDPDAAVLQNPFLHDAKLLDLDTGKIPYPDGSFDLVFADNVMEHIADPAVVLAEIFRVLKPGGLFLAKTPNRLHYMPIIAMLTPLWFHGFYNRLRGRSTFDTFPTHYRLNSSKAVRSFAVCARFDIISIDYFESRPEYLRLFSVSYLIGILYERIVNSMEIFRIFRILLIFTLRKPI